MRLCYTHTHPIRNDNGELLKGRKKKTTRICIARYKNVCHLCHHCMLTKTEGHITRSSLPTFHKRMRLYIWGIIPIKKFLLLVLQTCAKAIYYLYFSQVFINWSFLPNRHVQKVKAWHPTRARNVVLESTSVPNVKENGCQETAGPIWDRSV